MTLQLFSSLNIKLLTIPSSYRLYQRVALQGGEIQKGGSVLLLLFFFQRSLSGDFWISGWRALSRVQSKVKVIVVEKVSRLFLRHYSREHAPSPLFSFSRISLENAAAPLPRFFRDINVKFRGKHGEEFSRSSPSGLERFLSSFFPSFFPFFPCLSLLFVSSSYPGDLLSILNARRDFPQRAVLSHFAPRMRLLSQSLNGPIVIGEWTFMLWPGTPWDRKIFNTVVSNVQSSFFL